jgi:hypothetical protein
MGTNACTEYRTYNVNFLTVTNPDYIVSPSTATFSIFTTNILPGAYMVID